ncbi:hypothetical protein HanXRQr2_Chr04g0184171 [Helianthus annuus]|uniref:Uncharacterized protein n=1 Tax=Helianthus annuus TaxID=4232 RepID=A0A9K3JAN0_HELAN|nr:hypothetical protein HanXRQr2_Chr04g0184171 [Helianthus annuus]
MEEKYWRKDGICFSLGGLKVKEGKLRQLILLLIFFLACFFGLVSHVGPTSMAKGTHSWRVLP